MVIITMWSDICYLGETKEFTNEYGDNIEEVEYDDYIFCNTLAIGMREFYQAQATGLKPEVKIEIKKIEYNNERYVKFEDEEYTVIRTYPANSEDIELTLTRGVNIGNT